MSHFVTAASAKSLAVAYEAYTSAATERDDLGIRVWGKMLLAAQADTGIQIASPSNVEAMIAAAGRRIAESELPLIPGEATYEDEDDGVTDDGVSRFDRAEFVGDRGW